MRLLHVSDTHLGHRALVRGAPAGWQRSGDHLHALVLALQPALREEVDLVVHSGDLFDRSRPPLAVMAQAVAVLVEASRRVPVLIMPGNHDRRGLRRYLPLREPGLTVLDEPARHRVGGLALGVVPFYRDAAAWARHAREVGEGADLLVCHQAFDGAAVPGLVFREGWQRDTVGARHLPEGVGHVMCGHIHPRQAIRVGGVEVVHPGSTERTAFSERDQVKGVVQWEVGAGVSWRWVDLPSRPMVMVRGEADLERVVPGALVRCAPEHEGDVLERGGWLVGRPGSPAPRVVEAERQAGLFARSRDGGLDSGGGAEFH